MMLIEETSVPDAALPVDAFKGHLRLGTGFDTDTLQDEVLVSFLRAALAAIEARTGKALIRRNFSWSLMAWRTPEGQGLPVAPVQMVSSVTIIARDGVETVIDPERYWLERDMQRPTLRPTSTLLPTIPTAGSVVIALEAGFGATWAEVPADLKQAVFLLAAHYYEFRHETNLSDGCMPFGVSSLIERYRNLRIGVGASR
ncbi:head-tail connector protein [Roseobacter sp. GAI101]|uniref:head-tail connector protein n=1 Tax=Roseobacter sp. (strain GAI101) TaxID=391589 RepID=UPI0002DAADC4|nr:head-tail connector protein [Roseobacter sp. GAI101]